MGFRSGMLTQSQSLISIYTLLYLKYLLLLLFTVHVADIQVMQLVMQIMAKIGYMKCRAMQMISCTA